MQLLQMFHIFPLIFFTSWGPRRAPQLATLVLSFCLLAPLSACSQAEEGSRSTRRAIAQSQAIAADFLRTELALSPETASRLNLERELGPSAAYALDNHSQAGFERRRLVRIELLQRLASRPLLSDQHPLTRDLKVCEAALRDLISLEQLGFGRFSYAELRPYAIDPYSGIWADGPALLAYRQSITRADQANAYLSRLRSLSAALQDTRRRLIADQASGVLLPRALALETQARMTRLVDASPDALAQISETFNALIRDIETLEPSERSQMVNAVHVEIERNLRPAYRDLLESVAVAAIDGADHPGLWAQPRGQDLFSGILTASLGERLNAERLHARHLESVEARRGELQRLLEAPSESDDIWPPRPETLTAQLEWFRAQSLGLDGTNLSAPQPAPQTATLAELAPATAWQRMTRAAEHPEHVMTLERFQSLLEMPPYATWRTEETGLLAPQRRLVEYRAITAAWQLYVWHTASINIPTEPASLQQVEQVRIGLIQASLAAVDTGLHLDRWTLNEATDFITNETGLNRSVSENLAMTITARPGHHTAIMAAIHRIEALSERAKAVLGAKYDEFEFQRVLIQPGPRPLPMIETDIETWYGAQLPVSQSN